MLKEIVIYTDGACLGNPGPGGWAAIIQFDRHEKIVKGAEKDTTNNRMELTAAIKALEALTEPCHITVFTDSVYVQKGVTEWLSNWKKRNWKTASKKPVKNVDLWLLMDKAIISHNISWQWVKGHSGNVGNERVDELARQVIEEVLG